MLLSPYIIHRLNGFCDSLPRRITLKQNQSPAVPSLSPPHPATFKTKPTNFLLLSKEHNTHLRRIHIDLCKFIPFSILPLGEDKTEDDRKNLCLMSRFGSVHAEIWVLDTPGAPVIGAPNPRRTTMALTSDYGSICAQLVRRFIFISLPSSCRPTGALYVVYPRRCSPVVTDSAYLPRDDPTRPPAFLPGTPTLLHAPRQHLRQQRDRPEGDPSQSTRHHTVAGRFMLTRWRRWRARRTC